MTAAPSDFFDCDFFALFGLPHTTEIDTAALRTQYQQLQAAAHPDRFAGAGESEKHAALQMASRINDAFTVLKNPLSRAAYILELRGVAVFAEDNTAMPPDFLMQQIEWREGFESADAAECDSLLSEISAARDAVQKDAAASLQKDDLAAATDAVRRWKYLDKMLTENAPPPQ